MPKAGTAADREPADVKRVAAAEGIPSDKTPTPVELAPTAGPIKLDKLPFFEMLARLSEREWEDRIVYLYRQDKNIIKEDPKDSNYIARITHAFDEPYVKDKFGGGRFLAILKNVRINGAERKHSFLIEGSPIIQEGEISIAKKTEAGAGGKSETALLLEQVEKLTQRLLDVGTKSNAAEQDTISRSVAMLSEARGHQVTDWIFHRASPGGQVPGSLYRQTRERHRSQRRSSGSVHQNACPGARTQQRQRKARGRRTAGQYR
jgi:hypothetical protein